MRIQDLLTIAEAQDLDYPGIKFDKPSSTDIMNRKDMTRVDGEPRSYEVDYDPESDANLRIDQERLKKLMGSNLRKLDTTSREVLSLRYWDELPYDEIARRMRMPKEQVVSVEKSALRKLKHISGEAQPFLRRGSP